MSTAALRHPHIVPVLNVGSSEGIFYFVMEYCAGRSLDYLMAAHGGRLSLALAGPIILQTLEGLAFAHEQGIVHRDLKPQNILLSSATHPILFLVPRELAPITAWREVRTSPFSAPPIHKKSVCPNTLTAKGHCHSRGPRLPRVVFRNNGYVRN